MKFVEKIEKLFDDLFKKEEVACNSDKIKINLVEETDGKRIFQVDLKDCSEQDADVLINNIKQSLKKQMDEKTDIPCDKIWDDWFFTKGTKPLVGVMMIYIDVGTLSIDNALKLIQDRKKQYAGLFERLPEEIGVMFIPVRPPSQTRVELFRFGL
jgi:hypothetical protein